MTIIYAKAGGPPANWQDLVVLKDGKVWNRHAVEVDVLNCWAKTWVLDANGDPVPDPNDPSNIWLEKVYGNFTIIDQPREEKVVVHPPGGWDEPKDVIDPAQVSGGNQVIPPSAHDWYFGGYPPITSDDDPGDADPQVYLRSPHGLRYRVEGARDGEIEPFVRFRDEETHWEFQQIVFHRDGKEVHWLEALVYMLTWFGFGPDAGQPPVGTHIEWSHKRQQPVLKETEPCRKLAASISLDLSLV